MPDAESSTDVKRGIITFAYGAQEYINLGIALGQSLSRSNPQIKRAIVTDSSLGILSDLFDEVIPLNREWGSDVSQKLHIDEYSPFDQTLFVDCDSLALADISFAFELFQNANACALGTEMWTAQSDLREADIAKVMESLNITGIPAFNGGVYYITRSGPQANVIQRARELLSNYRDYGFNDFRSDGPADEMVMGAAMAELGCQLVDDKGLLMRTPIGLQGDLHVDVIRGVAQFNKSGCDVRPAIVHFAGGWRKHHVYARECHKLRILTNAKFLPETRAVISGALCNGNHWFKGVCTRCWTLVPRPIRLLWHGVFNRMSSTAGSLKQ